MFRPNPLPLFALFFSVLSLPAYAQNPLFCQAGATPLTVRSEGLAEKVGDIILQCSGGTPAAVVTGGITISLNVPITNRLTAGTAHDIVVTVDTGAGPVGATVAATSLNTVTVALTGITFTTPAAGAVTIRIDNLRAAMTGLGTSQVVVAQLALNGLSTLLARSSSTAFLPSSR